MDRSKPAMQVRILMICWPEAEMSTEQVATFLNWSAQF